MLVTELPNPTDGSLEAETRQVVLADGSQQSLQGLSTDQLHRLQWQQEQLFARQIQHAPKGSPARTVVISHAYDTICAILATLRGAIDRPLVMGLSQRDVRLVSRLLQDQKGQQIECPRLFEIGYGSGVLLQDIRSRGFDVSGIEVSHTMREQALKLLGHNASDQLLLGSLTDLSPQSVTNKPSLIYWNDVFEHICPDEILDYLRCIHRLLIPGGILITVTPNWLLRPMDVTGDFCPSRTTARGLHLKEYRLREVATLLQQAGFSRVATPLLVSRKQLFIAGNGLRSWKQLAEPFIDRIPVRLAHLACKGLGLSYTIATKG
jgi:SAM-dependent methyltransferase